MTTVFILVLLGAVRWSTSHVIYTKEPARITRLPFEDWRPIRETTGHRYIGHQGDGRYPAYNKGYKYSPSHKNLAQKTEQSENVEVFSPAPPTILGSFSVFGHATVNAREHASHITKKSPRPQLSPEYPQYDGRPKLNGYQLRHQYVSPSYSVYSEPPKRPQKYNEYNEQAYYFDASLRPPPREINNKVSAYSPHAQSTSLTPNTFYFEQPQPFQPSGVDNSYHKVQKPNKPVPHTPYQLGGQSQTHYPTISPVDSFRTPVTNEFEPSSLSYYSNGFNGNKKIPSHVPYYHRNPFGDIHLNSRRPEQNVVKPVTEEKESNKNGYDHYSHIGRPFQNTHTYTTTIGQKEIQTFQPFVTTFPSVVEPHNVKFSEVAQPFQVSDYQTQVSPLSGIKPDYIVTQQPFTQDVYPITVTTIDVPVESYQQAKKVQKVTESAVVSPKPSRPSRPTGFETFPNHKPHVQISSYQGYKNAPTPFLPTPSPDIVPYISEPTSEDQSTETPDTNDLQDVISTVDSKFYQENTEVATDSPSTTVMVETTTKYRPPKRRRPSRPSHTRNDLTTNTNLKNHRLNEDVSSTTSDYYKHQRRRKPSKYREGSEFKRQRTTTTTTQKPEIFEPTEHSDDTTTFGDDNSGHLSRVQNDEIMTKFKDDDDNSYVLTYNAPHLQPSDVQIPENEQADENDEIYRHSTPRSTTMTTSTTTTTEAPLVSVTTPTVETVTNSITSRLKNKYGNNRPRFSVKDYRERLNKATSTTPPTSPDIEKPVKVKNESNRYTGRIRTRPTQEATTASSEQSESTTESKFKKYKSRIGPSRYKTSTTQQPEGIIETTTTERVNTFRPSTNRYKPGTGKYYSRYRTSTIAPKEADDSPVPTAKVTIKPKGVFSAKRRPFPMKPKLGSNSNNEDLSAMSEDTETTKFGDSFKMDENEVVPDVITKKMDNGITTTMSNGEISSTKASSISDVPADSSDEEAKLVADLTSSSSNDYHSPSVLRASNRRPVHKITLPTDEPILPLEAFFQTHNKE